ncbi:MAG TPA: RNA polymerase sigma factor [Terracidiphilus sp.]|nr:RNA polymerase sigma factor [Terracidiphilus sp.]
MQNTHRLAVIEGSFGALEDSLPEKTSAAPPDFAAVAERHRSRVFCYLLSSLRDADLAETLTQECFLKAHRCWSSFRGDSSAFTWLIQIATNLRTDYWRNRRMQFWRQTRTNAVDAGEAGHWLPDPASSPEAQVAAREQVERVWTALRGLKGRQRTIFLLRYVEELELREIARTTGLREGTVKAHLSRALGKVRAELRSNRPRR